MNSSYSTKALPAGTVLREWRLEEVLGVGGFGIVYKGRGIYFDELVAIKEYFPSAISERKPDDTVVPMDSNAEEVHALGLKKFVEEAKLLWNLSSPTRHPNIVSVRAFFEIHGTAYMVMDFEDGISLSKWLKQGRRFNQASLTALVRPIAEGLERAHRVGVLHRDIKPPNILLSEDGRPVLIDFGSARFESGDATSTTVTFHTPPYAAIEQYVKTYKQGPWTDIYALGVVLYECVTGTKPPEVLERLHGGLGTALLDGDWPGYSRSFLAAIDAAMTIRPDDRPQSISEWLALFDQPAETEPHPAALDDDDERTRLSAYVALPQAIVPVAPVPADFHRGGPVDTPVPDDIREVQFKLAGNDTNASRKQSVLQAPGEAIPPATGSEAPAASSDTERDAQNTAASAATAKSGGASSNSPPRSSRKKILVLTGVAAVSIAGLAGYLARDNGENGAPKTVLPKAAAAPPSTGIDNQAPDAGLPNAMKDLVAQARAGHAPAAAVKVLEENANKVSALAAATPAPKGAGAEMEAVARSGGIALIDSLVADVSGKYARLGRDIRWTTFAKRPAASSLPPAIRQIASELEQSRQQLLDAQRSASAAADAVQVIAASRQAVAGNVAFNTAMSNAYRAGPVGDKASVAHGTVNHASSASAAREPAAAAPIAMPSQVQTVAGNVSAKKISKFNSIVSEAREIADRVIRIEKGIGGSASGDAGRMIRQNAQAARTYLSYLDQTSAQMRNAKSDGEAGHLIDNANRTKAYLREMLSRSMAAQK